jgi:hypothetical protein
MKIELKKYINGYKNWAKLHPIRNSFILGFILGLIIGVFVC